MAYAMPRGLFVFLTRLALAVVFLGAGLQKLLGSRDTIAYFYLDAFPDWFAIAVGIVEIVAAVGLLLQRYAPYAAGLLVPIMAGAIWTTLQADKRIAEEGVQVPILLGALLVAIAIRADLLPQRSLRPRRPRPRQRVAPTRSRPPQ